MNTNDIKLPLLITRIGIILFLTPWVLMRLTKVEAGTGIFAKYYHISNLPDIAGYLIGGFWLVLLIAFAIGFKKKISYGLVMIFHTLGTVMTIPYLIPGTANFNILFMAAIPTAAAMYLLFVLRDQDTMLSLNKD